MSTPLQAVEPARLPAPQLGRRARRRHGAVLLLFGAVCLALAVLSVVWLFSDEVANAPEGLLALSLVVCGLLLLCAALALAGFGLWMLLRKDVVRTPSWRVDPSDAAQVRWWDGEAWTEHVAPRDPTVAALAPPARRRSRRTRGLLMLGGGIAVAVVSDVVAGLLVIEPTDPAAAPNPLPMLVMQATLPAIGVALVGLYLALTLDPATPPSWRHDPLDASRLRWWDGDAWSDATTEPVAS